jgi:hypothetical protein
MKILIPHLFYTIEVKDKKLAKGKVKRYLEEGDFYACYEAINKNNSKIWIKLPVKPTEVPTLVHEIIHCLQHLSRERDIDFKSEEEHFAYLTQYILNQILGYEFI